MSVCIEIIGPDTIVNIITCKMGFLPECFIEEVSEKLASAFGGKNLTLELAAKLVSELNLYFSTYKLAC